MRTPGWARRAAYLGVWVIGLEAAAGAVPSKRAPASGARGGRATGPATKASSGATRPAPRVLALSPSDADKARSTFAPFAAQQRTLPTRVKVQAVGSAPEHVKSFGITLRDGAGQVLRDAKTPEVFDVAWTSDTD